MTKRPDLGRLKAILFDFDGVVVQSEDVYDRATKKLGDMYGIHIPQPYYESNRGIAETLFYERFKATFELDVDMPTLQENGRKLLWSEFSSSVHYTPGFQQFYRKIRKQVSHVAMVTATPRPLIDEIFKNSNIEVDFDFIVTSSDVKETKPAPDSYLKACEICGVEPAQALVIEDSPTGLRSATAAGCQTVGITTSCGQDSLKEANFVVDSFGELEELLTIV
ncbi:MAG: HAD family phosphatase [Candidatus Marinimicrobia bacterium]|nr:HAD family phosphatase [Candidatus Neomarinimicrobiota bacterium]MCF7921588.1 HAD family phosphatase [Candidatus Neomarinimicrobiota bacterium]